MPGYPCCCPECRIEKVRKTMSSGSDTLCTTKTNTLSNKTKTTFHWLPNSTEPWADYTLTVGGVTVTLTADLATLKYKLQVSYEGRTLWWSANHTEGVTSSTCASQTLGAPKEVIVNICHTSITVTYMIITGVIAATVEIDVPALASHTTTACMNSTGAGVSFPALIKYEYNDTLSNGLDCRHTCPETDCPICDKGVTPHRLQLTVDDLWYGDQYGNTWTCTGGAGTLNFRVCDCSFIGKTYELTKATAGVGGYLFRNPCEGAVVPVNSGTRCCHAGPTACYEAPQAPGNCCLDIASILINCPGVNIPSWAPADSLYTLDINLNGQYKSDGASSGGVGGSVCCTQRAAIRVNAGLTTGTGTDTAPYNCHGPFVITFPRPDFLTGGPTTCTTPYQTDPYWIALRQITLVAVC